MSIKASKMMMKCVGATLAFCSAMALAGGCCCSGSSSTKKFMKKTMNKMSDVVDTLASFM